MGSWLLVQFPGAFSPPRSIILARFNLETKNIWMSNAVLLDSPAILTDSTRSIQAWDATDLRRFSIPDWTFRRFRSSTKSSNCYTEDLFSKCSAAAYAEAVRSQQPRRPGRLQQNGEKGGGQFTPVTSIARTARYLFTIKVENKKKKSSIRRQFRESFNWKIC